MFKRSQIASVTAEFLGTAILVMVALILSQTTSVSYFIGTSLAAALAVIYVIFGSVSGAHVNPAVTFGMWTARRIRTIKAVAFIAAQLLGGLAALMLYQYFTNHNLPVKNQSFNTPMFLAEMVGAGVLTLGVTTAIARKYDALLGGVLYGLSMFVGILVASTAAAGYLNPAIALGSRSWNAIYVLGPLTGGLIGVNLYYWLFTDQKLLRRK